MTPWQLAKDTEHSQQRAIFAWANCAARFGFAAANDTRGYSEDGRLELGLLIPFLPVPEMAMLFAIHNQGHGDAIRGAQAKAEGVKAGVPDMMLPIPVWAFLTSYAGLFIELKKTKKGIVSNEQIAWAKLLQERGYYVEICKGWIEAVNCIQTYLQTGTQTHGN